MNPLIDDPLKIVASCKGGNKEDVIIALLSDRKLQKFVMYLVEGNKVAYDSLMHDTVLSFVRTCMKPNFVIEKNPRAYVKAIAKNAWLMQKRKNKLKTVSIDDDEFKIELSSTYLVDNDKRSVVQKLLSKVPVDCQKILYLWAMKYRMKEIADAMDVESENYIKKKKHICIKKLIAAVENDPKFKDELKLYV